MIHTARVLMDAANRLIDEAALAERTISYLEQTRNKGETVFATDLLVKAVDKLMYVSGSSGFSETTPLQRYWRDLNMAARHAANVPQRGLRNVWTRVDGRRAEYRAASFVHLMPQDARHRSARGPSKRARHGRGEPEHASSWKHTMRKVYAPASRRLRMHWCTRRA